MYKYKATVIGGTHLHTDGRRYRKGESFKIRFKGEIPETFHQKFSFEPLAPIPDTDNIVVEEKQGENVSKKTDTLKIENSNFKLEDLGWGWYNVLDGNGKCINAVKLRLAEAKRLIAETDVEDEESSMEID